MASVRCNARPILTPPDTVPNAHGTVINSMSIIVRQGTVSHQIWRSTTAKP